MIVGGIFRDYVVHDLERVHGFFGAYRWMSNFHQCVIYYDGHRFPSTENAYVYAKQTNMPDNLIEVLKTCGPSEAKRIGSTLELRHDWDDVRVDVMSTVVFDKFARHPGLREMLLATGDRHLEETNHWNDRFWGVCDGHGKNHLGRMLMGIRRYWSEFYPDLVGLGKPTKLF